MSPSKLTLFVMLASLALCAGTAQAQTIYRWVDEQGTVHFGELPPAGSNATAVSISNEKTGTVSPLPAPTEPPLDASESAPAAATSLPGENTEEQVSYAQQVRNERAEKRASKVQDKQKIEAQCVAMRNQLAHTEPNPRVIVPTPDGGSRRLGDDERLALVNEAKTFIAQNCN